MSLSARKGLMSAKPTRWVQTTRSDYWIAPVSGPSAQIDPTGLHFYHTKLETFG